MANSAGDSFIDVRPELSGFGPALGKAIDPHVDRAASGITSKLGGAFRAVAGIAGGIGAGLAVGSFFKGAFAEAEEARKTLAQTNSVLQSTGGEAGVTAKSVGALADKLSALTGMDDEAIASTENLLLTFTNIHNEAGKGNDIFDQTTKAVLDMSVALGQDSKSSAIQLGKALNDPIKGITALTRVGVAFTEQQKDQIKSLVESGRTLDAQKIILAEINKEFGGSAAAAASPLARLRVAWGNLQETVGNGALPILSKAATFLADQLPGAVEKAGRVFGPIVDGIKLFVGSITGLGANVDLGRWTNPIIDAGALVRGVFDKLVAFVSTNGPKVQAALAPAFDFIEKNAKPILAALGVAFVALTAPITGIVAAVVLAYTRFQGFRDVVDLVVRTVLDQLGNLVSWFKTVWPQIQEAVGHVVAAVQAIWRTFGDELVSVAMAAWDQVRNIVQTAVDLVRGVISTVLALINGDWGKAWDGIKGIVSTAWEFIRETVVNALTVVREVLEAGLDVVRGAWERVWNGIKDFLAGVWDAITDVARRGVANLVDVFLGMVGTIIHAADSAFGWLPGLGGKLHEARQAFDNFRDGVNASIRGIDAEKTITINIVEAVTRENNTNTGTAGDPTYNNGDPAPLDQYARGFDMGAVKGPLGKPRLVVAHGGEWIGTPEQMDDLATGRSGGAAPVSGPTAEAIGRAVAAALASQPLVALMDSDHFGRAAASAATSYR